MTHSTLCPGVDLVEIVREAGASDKVVRWCPSCGAVVVDEDYDGRVRPGAYIPMLFPKLVAEKLAMGLATGTIPASSLTVGDQEKLLEDVGSRIQAREALEAQDGQETPTHNEGAVT